MAESYLRLGFREEVCRAVGRLPRLAVFLFDAAPRFAAALRLPLAFVTRRAFFPVRFAARGEVFFFADAFLRLLPLFFGEGFRAVLLGF